MELNSLIAIRACSRRIIDICDSKYNKRDVIIEASTILTLVVNEIEKQIALEKARLR